jgi:hypothetical protein
MGTASVTEHQLETLRWVIVKGDGPAVFAALGEHLRPIIQEAVSDLIATTGLATGLEREPVRARFQSISALLPSQHPLEWTELQELATGAGMPLEDLLLVNVRGDLGRDDFGCSGLAQTRETGLIWCHNEDADPALIQRCFLLTIDIDGSPTVTTWFYPGFLPGHTFTVSDAGMMWGVFNINIVSPPALAARSFVARGMQRCRSLDEATAHLANHPSAGGFGYILCSSERPAARVIETGAGAMSVTHTNSSDRASLWHTNHLRYLNPGSDAFTSDSAPRGAVLEHLTQAPIHKEQLRAALADTPLPDGVRATSATDAATLATIIVDQAAGSAELLTPREHVFISVEDLATGRTESVTTLRRHLNPWE